LDPQISKFFISTADRKERIAKIGKYIQYNIPVLLEEQTGTAKTKSDQFVCLMTNHDFIIFNLSAETTTEDLIGRLIRDPNTWGGFQLTHGPFIDAFSEGKCLLLDEINLASSSVLQSNKAVIHSQQINIDIPRILQVQYQMNQNVGLIATQNPNEGGFKMKRENLTSKLLA
jgi:midasin (ATPase involved in ribosome maturation)